MKEGAWVGNKGSGKQKEEPWAALGVQTERASASNIRSCAMGSVLRGRADGDKPVALVIVVSTSTAKCWEGNPILD